MHGRWVLVRGADTARKRLLCRLWGAIGSVPRRGDTPQTYKLRERGLTCRAAGRIIPETHSLFNCAAPAPNVPPSREFSPEGVGGGEIDAAENARGRVFTMEPNF